MNTSIRSRIYSMALGGVILTGAAACEGAVFHEFQGRIQTTQRFEDPRVIVGFNPQPEPPAHPPEPVMGDPTMPVFGWSNDAHHYEIVFGFDLGGDVSFNPQPEPPAGDGRFTFSLTVPGASPDTFDVLLDLNINGTLDRASWVGFNPQPEPPAFEGKTIGFAFEVIPNSPTDVTLGFSIADHDTGESASFTFIPEPTTATLSVSAVLAILLRRRGRRHEHIRGNR